MQCMTRLAAGVATVVAGIGLSGHALGGVVISDDFSQADVTLAGQTTPVGSATWSANGTVNISGQEVVNADNSNAIVPYSPPADKIFTLAATVRRALTGASNHSTGIGFSDDGSTPYSGLTLMVDIAGWIYLVHDSFGNYPGFASDKNLTHVGLATDYAGDLSLLLRLDPVNNKATAVVNGIVVYTINYTIPTPINGAGFYNSATGGGTYDDLLISEGVFLPITDNFDASDRALGGEYTPVGGAAWGVDGTVNISGQAVVTADYSHGLVPFTAPTNRPFRLEVTTRRGLVGPAGHATGIGFSDDGTTVHSGLTLMVDIGGNIYMVENGFANYPGFISGKTLASVGLTAGYTGDLTLMLVLDPVGDKAYAVVNGVAVAAIDYTIPTPIVGAGFYNSTTGGGYYDDFALTATDAALPITDTFNRADGDLMGQDVPQGGTFWLVSSGTASISGQAVTTTVDGTDVIVPFTAPTDTPFMVETTVRRSLGGAGGHSTGTGFSRNGVGSSSSLHLMVDINGVIRIIDNSLAGYEYPGKAYDKTLADVGLAAAHTGDLPMLLWMDPVNDKAVGVVNGIVVYTIDYPFPDSIVGAGFYNSTTGGGYYDDFAVTTGSYLPAVNLYELPISDSFNRADAALVGQTTPVGGAMWLDSGTVNISGQEVVNADNSHAMVYFTPPTNNPYQVSVTTRRYVTGGGGHSTGVGFSDDGVAPTSGLTLMVDKVGDIRLMHNNFADYPTGLASGKNLTHAGLPTDYTGNLSLRVRIDPASGTAIGVVNGVVLYSISYTAPDPIFGAGFYNSLTGGGGTYDDFSVEAVLQGQGSLIVIY